MGLPGMFAGIGQGMSTAAQQGPNMLAQRRRKLLEDAFKLLAQPSKQPKRKKAIGKKDLLPLLLGSAGAALGGADPGAIGKGLMSFAGTRQGMADQDYQDQQGVIGEENRVRDVEAKKLFAMEGLASEEEQRFRDWQKTNRSETREQNRYDTGLRINREDREDEIRRQENTAREAARKEGLASLEQRRDNLRQEIITHTATYGGTMPPELYNDLQRKRQYLVDAGAIDVPSLPPNGVMTKAQREANENQARLAANDKKQDARSKADDDWRKEEREYRRSQDSIQSARWFAEKAAQGIITGTPGNWTINPNFKDKKEKGAEISRTDAEIRKARAEARALKETPFIADPDPDKAVEKDRERTNQLALAIWKEWNSVMYKRKLVGGKQESVKDYAKTHYGIDYESGLPSWMKGESIKKTTPTGKGSGSVPVPGLGDVTYKRDK